MAHTQPHARSRLALLLAGCRGAGRRAVAQLDTSDDPLAAADALPAALRAAARDVAAAAVDTTLAQVHSRGWRWLVPGDDEYPQALAATADPPLGLFVRGPLPPAPVVAVVGSRRATPYGLQVARLLGEELGRSGVVVVSGMARGVDSAAHEGVVDAGGRTWAVWGTGPDRVYPAEHRGLAESIVTSGGALLTEYPPGTPPRQHHFPERNRILAGLASAVVVVEAAARSGALNTARQAVDEGREVLAVPGSILSELSVGPNALLRMGARPLVTARDVLELVGAASLPAAGARRCDPVLDAVPPGTSASVDEVAVSCGRSVQETAARLLELEIDGAVLRAADGRYRRVSAKPAAE